jgi:hypothetical protein
VAADRGQAGVVAMALSRWWRAGCGAGAGPGRLARYRQGVTWSDGYVASTPAHCECVLRGFSRNPELARVVAATLTWVDSCRPAFQGADTNPLQAFNREIGGRNHGRQPQPRRDLCPAVKDLPTNNRSYAAWARTAEGFLDPNNQSSTTTFQITRGPSS